jgi:hypothetical protein
MKTYLAMYIGTEASMNESGWNTLDEAERKEREKAGVKAWHQWVEKHRDSIVDTGAPLGRTLRVSRRGVEKTRNELVGYTVVRADSHEAAAEMFENHPHFTVFPGESIEIMECLPMPG